MKDSIQSNIINSQMSLRKACRQIKKSLSSHDSGNLRYFVNYGMLLFENLLMKKRSVEDIEWQNVSSLDKQIDGLIKLIEDKNIDKPFYASFLIRLIAYLNSSCCKSYNDVDVLAIL